MQIDVSENATIRVTMIARQTLGFWLLIGGGRGTSRMGMLARHHRDYANPHRFIAAPTFPDSEHHSET